jgi:hypothetical protein
MGYLERACEYLERIIAEAARSLSEENAESGGGGSSLSSSTLRADDTGHLVALKNQSKLNSFLININ